MNFFSIFRFSSFLIVFIFQILSFFSVWNRLPQTLFLIPPLLSHSLSCPPINLKCHSPSNCPSSLHSYCYSPWTVLFLLPRTAPILFPWTVLLLFQCSIPPRTILFPHINLFLNDLYLLASESLTCLCKVSGEIQYYDLLRDSILMTSSAYQVWGTTWAQGAPAESES